MFEITQAERWCWQRRATTELAAILDQHRHLPPITWLLPTGATLVGKIDSLQPRQQAHDLFHTWRNALHLGNHTQTTSSTGTTHLRADSHRNHVLVVLTATVNTHDE